VFEPRKRQIFGSSPIRPYSLWGPHSLILNGYLQGLKRPKRNADHSPFSSRLKMSGAVPPVPHCGFREWTGKNLLFVCLTGSHTHSSSPRRILLILLGELHNLLSLSTRSYLHSTAKHPLYYCRIQSRMQQLDFKLRHDKWKAGLLPSEVYKRYVRKDT